MNSINLTIQDYAKQVEEQQQITEHAKHVADATTEAYQKALYNFEMATDTMKKNYTSKIAEKDSVIKVMAVSLLTVTVCAILFGAKLVTLKC